MRLSRFNFLRKAPPCVAVLRLSGLVAATATMRRGLSMAVTAPLIDKAFAIKRVQAVALVVNSPGGSPVQSALIFERIRYLSKQKQVPVIAFVEDVAASGGYWLACAGDEIHVNPASVVGSIGVVSAGFGFDEAIARLGIARRLYTSGARKAMLDSFSPEQADDVAHLKALQADIHNQFIAMVKRRRGARLKGEEAEIFSGAFWTGRQAVELGLADHIGEIRQVMESRFGDKVELRLIQRPRSLLGLSSGGEGVHWADAATDRVVDRIAERFHYMRFGLY